MRCPYPGTRQAQPLDHPTQTTPSSPDPRRPSLRNAGLRSDALYRGSPPVSAIAGRWQRSGQPAGAMFRLPPADPSAGAPPGASPARAYRDYIDPAHLVADHHLTTQHRHDRVDESETRPAVTFVERARRPAVYTRGHAAGKRAVLRYGAGNSIVVPVGMTTWSTCPMARGSSRTQWTCVVEPMCVKTP